MRMLGLMLKKCKIQGPLAGLKKLFMSEMVTRAAKSILRGVMRHSAALFPSSENAIFAELLLHFNFIFGKAPLSAIYWETVLKIALMAKFEVTFTRQEWLAMKDLMNDVAIKQTIFQSLQLNLGINFR